MRSRNMEEGTAYGSGWTAIGCIVPNNNNNNNSNNNNNNNNNRQK